METEDLAPLKEILDVFIDEKAIRKSNVKLGFCFCIIGDAGSRIDYIK
jgi:hypothetical protein